MEKEFSVTDELLASQGQRFLNYLIDFIVQVLIYLVLEVILIIVASLLGFEGIGEKIRQYQQN